MIISVLVIFLKSELLGNQYLMFMEKIVKTITEYSVSRILEKQVRIEVGPYKIGCVTFAIRLTDWENLAIFTLIGKNTVDVRKLCQNQ